MCSAWKSAAQPGLRNPTTEGRSIGILSARRAMKHLKDCSDVRNQGPCIHCGGSSYQGSRSRDHVPTRALLDRPYPDGLPTVEVCGECNNGFSKDEDYLVALIACVISGSLELSRHEFPVVAGILARSVELAARIERTRRVQLTLWGDPEVEWTVEPDRVASVVVKNARGHALYELGEPLLHAPGHALFSPLHLMSDDQRDLFEHSAAQHDLWPEVGSRMMQRMAEGDLEGGWVVVQRGVYRYMVVQRPGETLVRSAIREYLATEVSWSDGTDGSAV